MSSFPAMPRVFSGQATQDRVWSESVSTYLIFCKSMDLVLIFFLVCLSLLTNGSSFLVFFFFFPMSLKALGTKDHVMTLVSPQVV